MKILLISYDNESLVQWFPQGLAYLAGTILENGHEVEIYEQDIHHYPEEHLTNYLDNNYFDIVGLSFIGGYYEYKKAIKISEAINKSKQRPFYVLGGFGPSPDPKYFLNLLKADAIVMGEGEVTTIDLINHLERKQPLDDVLGLAFLKDSEVKINPSRPLIEDVDSIPMPA